MSAAERTDASEFRGPQVRDSKRKPLINPAELDPSILLRITQSARETRNGTMKNARKIVAAVCVAMVLSLFASACSSSSNPSTAAAAQGTASGKGSACAAAAAAKVKKASQPIPMNLPPAFSGSTASGKSYAFVGSNVSKAETGAAAAFSAAAKVVGAKAVLFLTASTPDAYTQSFDSAIAQHVSAIVIDGFAPTLIPAAITAAKNAHIPVVLGINGQPNGALAPGVVANVTMSAADEGVMQADYAAAATDCNLKAAYIYTQESEITVELYNAAQAELASLCPTTCSLQGVQFNAATYTTSGSGQISALLEANPKINFLIAASDAFVPYTLQGIATAGKSTPVVGATGSTLAQAQAGSDEVADVLWPPAGLVGYFMFDTAMRAGAGVAKNVNLPVALVDKSNWGAPNSVPSAYVKIGNYAEAFKNIWGG
jgi:ABC-type sugar transport system substrate-binding protein